MDRPRAGHLGIGRMLIAEQRRRIERQRLFVSDLGARDRHDGEFRDASVQLRQMIRNLDLMMVNLHRIEQCRSG